MLCLSRKHNIVCSLPGIFAGELFGFGENREDFGAFWLVPALNTDRIGPFCANICRTMVVFNTLDLLVQLAINPCLPHLRILANRR